MNKFMSKITFYENILEFKENTKEQLNLNEINNWQLCRTCLANTNEDDVNVEKMSVIDVMEGSFLTIKEMLVNMTDIKITPIENLPIKVCKRCFSKITELYYFSIQVRKAGNVIKRLVSKVKGYHDNENPEDSVIFDLEEVFETNNFQEIQDPGDFDDSSIALSDENKILTEALEEDAYIKGTTEWFEAISETEAALLRDEACHSDSISKSVDEESDMEKCLMGDIEISDVDSKKTFEDTSTFTTTKETTTGKVEYKLKIVKRKKIKKPVHGYRHKQPRVSSPLLTSLTCAICGESFGRQADLVHHVKELHPNSKAYKCRVCDNLFSHIQSLSRHMNSHKETVVMNKCEFCKKTFVRADDLKRHLRVHTGERPYVCSFCKKSFQQQFALKSHEEKHLCEQMNLPPRKFECIQCDQTYTSRNGLYLHRIKHHSEDSGGNGLSYNCSLCEKSFHLLSEMKRHTEKHFLPKLIKCNECNLTFRSHNGMYVHKKKHHTSVNQANKKFEKGENDGDYLATAEVKKEEF